VIAPASSAVPTRETIHGGEPPTLSLTSYAVIDSVDATTPSQLSRGAVTVAPTSR